MSDPAMYAFDVSVFARPTGELRTKPTTLRGSSFDALALEPAELCVPFARSFEEVYDVLEAIDRMFIEPDGSFVLRNDSPAWQIDGHLYDRQGRLLYVELRGAAPSAVFDRLLAALGWPATPVIFQWRLEGVVTDEATFRLAAMAVGNG